MSDHVEVVRREGAALVDAVERDPTAPIGCYAGWDVAQLARHTGQIHRWVTDVVRTRAAERPTGMPDVESDDDRLATWLAEGVDELAAALEELDADEQLWTITRHDRSGRFWRRRMALETTLHRWDAEDAQDRAPTVDPKLALLGVCRVVGVARRAGPQPPPGRGQRVAIRPPEGPGWTVTVNPVGVEVAVGAADEVDAAVSGSALDLWLALTCRRGLDAVDVDGSRDAAALVLAAAAKLGGPAG
jgi:uncharacterized protein (TIGR03083 family)